MKIELTKDEWILIHAEIYRNFFLDDDGHSSDTKGAYDTLWKKLGDEWHED